MSPPFACILPTLRALRKCATPYGDPVRVRNASRTGYPVRGIPYAYCQSCFGQSRIFHPRYVSDNVMVNCHYDSEVVCSSSRGGVITSGGGFSNDFAMPW